MDNFIEHVTTKSGWKMEIEGPFKNVGDEFMYLKRKYNITNDGIVVRPDPRHMEELADTCEIGRKKAKNIPCSADINGIHHGYDLSSSDCTRFRSCVGKMMYISGERPDAQYAIHMLARMMSKPMSSQVKHVTHLTSYLNGTANYGIKLRRTKKGMSILDRRDIEEIEAQEHHLVEVITDADLAGCKNSRKSLTCFHIFLDGCLIESKVRSQKAIALSSGEAEFTAIVGGCSEALFVKHVVEFMTGDTTMVKARSDSSAARSMTARQGVGRVRHIDSGMMWIQEKVASGKLEITATPTLLNPADIGTKGLSQFRLKALAHILCLVDEYDIEIGHDEYKETEMKVRMQKKVNRLMTKGRDDMKMALIMMINMIAGVDGKMTEEESSWLDYAMLSMFILNVIGALSVATGMWMMLRWLMRDHTIPVNGGLFTVSRFNRLELIDSVADALVVGDANLTFSALLANHREGSEERHSSTAC
eukprot:g18422.t1